MLQSLANFFQSIARFMMLFIGMTMVAVSIFTGALNYGITIDNMLRNLPDSIPWFLVLFTLLIAWDFELVGGLIFLILGLGGIFYMQASNNATLPQETIMWAVVLSGGLFILSWSIRRVRVLSLI